LYLIFKNIFDFLFAIVFIVSFSPLFIFIIFLLKFFSNTDVFFIHKRIGKNGNLFSLYKFRTMKHSRYEILSDYLKNNPEQKKYWKENQKLKNDPRVTRIGYFLREYSLDELPQVLNVLKGDMSFIGPRPIVEEEKNKYGDKLVYYNRVKPGLSGLWQVSGRNNTSYNERVKFDCMYVSNISFFNDVKIFFKTIFVIIIKKGAY